jgi:hypothetical protein
MTSGSAYASPTAFRRAITDRLKAMADSGPWPLPALQRQFAYDRLLVRLYLVDDGWVVKGATALLAREIGVRGTKDIDVYRRSALDVAEADLRRAAALDLGDWCRFTVGAGHGVAPGAPGVRLPVTLRNGNSPSASFAVDLVGEQLVMTGEPESVPPLARLGIPDVEQRDYKAYPLVDHVADKVVATFARYGAGELPSTRFKDLLDLVAIVGVAAIGADAQRRALASEASRRGVALPTHFDVPDRPLWETGYAREARRSIVPMPVTLDDALDVVRPFIDPLLAESAQGEWDPRSRRWVLRRSGTKGRRE